MSLICVHGNIGVGKSTYINNMTESVEKKTENLEKWEKYFIKYYKAMSKKPGTLSLKEQCDIIEFQVLTTLTRLQNYENLEKGKKYVFERSIQESFYCFCPILRPYLTEDQNKILKDFMKQAICLEPNFDENIYLQEPMDVLLERIQERNREGEENINRHFLSSLQRFYDTFEQKNLYKPNVIKGNVYVVGPVASGKTTFTKKFQDVAKQIQTEPIQYWEPYLSLHLKNLQEGNECDVDERNNTFLFQLKCLVSRLKFRKPSQLHERVILEEPYIFMKQYEFLFSDTQLDLLNELYQYVSEKVFKIKDSTILFLKTSLERQIQNVQLRNRMNETKIYDEDYIKHLNELYQKMFQLEVFQKIKENGNFYVVSYENI